MNAWRRRWLLGIPILLVIVLLVPVFGVAPWSPLNCWNEEIDIRSGRIRSTRYLFWCRVRERISATPVSETLEPDDFDPASAEWMLVNTFSPGVRHSPHYRYHGAITQTRQLALLWDAIPFTSAARRESALRLLASWHKGGNDFAANSYLDALSRLVADRARASRQTIDITICRHQVRELPNKSLKLTRRQRGQFGV